MRDAIQSATLKQQERNSQGTDHQSDTDHIILSRILRSLIYGPSPTNQQVPRRSLEISLSDCCCCCCSAPEFTWSIGTFTASNTPFSWVSISPFRVFSEFGALTPDEPWPSRPSSKGGDRNSLSSRPFIHNPIIVLSSSSSACSSAWASLSSHLITFSSLVMACRARSCRGLSLRGRSSGSGFWFCSGLGSRRSPSRSFLPQSDEKTHNCRLDRYTSKSSDQPQPVAISIIQIPDNNFP